MDKSEVQLGLYAAELAKYCAEAFVDKKFVAYNEADNPYARRLDTRGLDDDFLEAAHKSGRPYKYEGVLHPEKVVQVRQGTDEDFARYAVEGRVYPADMKLMVEVEIAMADATRMREFLDGLMFNLIARHEGIGYDLYVVHRLPLVSNEVDATAPQTMTIVVKYLTA
jgi:hypothetical protein